ncbi:putative nicotinate-nucleotide pyrophosphorylase [carboxylating] [anaerobic digester metagenome]
MTDVRDTLFQKISEKRYRAVLTAEHSGVLSGEAEARACAENLGVEFELCKKDGDELSRGERFANLLASSKQIALAEEQLIGTLAKASGIATAARTAVQLADGKMKIVSGSWKKMPPQMKQMVRSATFTGGASFRICEQPMIYLDKNFIRMLGSIPKALEACKPFEEATKVVQIKGITGTIEEETQQAICGGGNIVMVDTGNLEDLRRCRKVMEASGKREKLKLAFAGGVRLTDIPGLADERIDILCIGKEIVDAQLLDMKLDVIQEET